MELKLHQRENFLAAITAPSFGFLPAQLFGWSFFAITDIAMTGRRKKKKISERQFLVHSQQERKHSKPVNDT